MCQMNDILIIGAGIGGLTLGLMAHRRGIPVRIFEAAPEIRPIGVGISILPHASKELTELGLQAELERVAVVAKESCFFNRFGQFVYKEPVGTYAGYPWPQFQIHRGDLQQVLYEAFVAEAGADRVVTGHSLRRVSSRTRRAPPPPSRSADATDGKSGSPGPRSSAPTASTRSSERNSTRMTAGRSIRASTCGAA